MEAPEVYFCDLCNASIPEQDIKSGSAAKVREKTIGACCLAEIRGRGASEPATAAGGGAGWFAAGLVSLVAVAGATMFLDWRLSEESKQFASHLRSTTSDFDSIEQRLVALEKQLDRTLVDGSLDPVMARVGAIGDELSGLEERLVGSVRANATRLRDLGAQIQSLDNGQRDHVARIAELHGELRRVGGRVDELIVVASTPIEESPVDEPELEDPGVVGASADLPPALPAALEKFIAQLSDADDGARFEAVDELLQSRDERVYPHVLPLASDPDPFVRRLVFEGLKDFRDPRSVDALILALEDPESLVRYTAHASLRGLTEQSMPFDPDAAAAKRASMVRRWQDWWKGQRAGFFKP